jgi:CRISPR-associated protein Cmr2
MTWEIDFSIGPVQGFVAQSRRTRDLWGSSYLLSYLSAHAMRGAVAAGGGIVRPRVDRDRLYQWVTGNLPGPPPRIGTVPNHFVIEADAAEAVAAAATEALREAWRQVTDAVWQDVVRPASHLGVGTEAIWRRQLDSYWEIVWVAAPKGKVDGLLARRKHWRTHRLPDEPGDKCTVMSDYQELSGHVRATGGAAGQDAFWNAVRDRAGALELRKDEERLCAPALVKRFFAKCDRKAIGGELDVDQWPSTVYIGAVPWLHEVRQRAADQADRYARALRQAAVPGTIRRRVPLAELRGAEPEDFLKLDANYYHRGRVAVPRLCPLNTGSARPELVKLLEQVYQAVGSGPPVYYALLLADGDSLGSLVAEVGADPVGEALATFGAQVDGVVEAHHGITVYAGGDDVLAMLPVRDALACADQLATAYAAAFAQVTSRPATLSAAVLFTHVRVPIGGALSQAHRLLDDVAKAANGRDSLVAAVLKPGGLHSQWVTSWIRTYPDGRRLRAVGQLAKLAEEMAHDGAGRGFSASLLQQMRGALEVLCGLRRWEPGRTGALPDDLDLAAYVRAELVDSWDDRLAGEPEPRLTELTSLVVDLLAPSPGTRDAQGTPVGVDIHRAGTDSLMLARFVAGGGREEEH